ncbi:hypothetical protein [Catellatospora sp. NPDC049609]|uniref:hypothetical protein n=1 Tax=Catellatospora sp. NPDC049609 TaxID=3155505 RepID=UPI003427CC61
MAGTNRFSKPIVFTLLAAILIGVVAVLMFPPLPLLLAALLLAGVFGGTAYLLSRRVAYLKQNQYFGQLGPQGKGRPAVDQFFTATASLAVLSVLLGFGAAFQALNKPAVVPVALPSAVPSIALPSETAPSPSPTPEPTEALEPSPSATPDPTDTPTDTPIDPSQPAVPGTTAHLDEMQPLAGSVRTGAVYMSAKRYPRSLIVYCYKANESYTDWNVAGYRSFKATLGIADDASNAYGVTGEFILYNQNGGQIGKPHLVSIGSPKQIEVDLTGVFRLRVTCSGRDTKTNKPESFRTILGDALIIA